MKLITSARKQTKIKLALQGIAGSGKTMSALLLAKGLARNAYDKVAVIDTEHGSSNLYAQLGNYKTLTLEAPYTPEKYIKAIDVCLNANMEVIILDGISQCWTYLLSYHASLMGNSFVNWNKVSQKQDAFIDKILQSPVHIIATMRTKQAYILNQINGKVVPQKIGLKAIQRNNVDFEFTTVLNIDANHICKNIKDRTGIFKNKKGFVIDERVGIEIMNWCNQEELNKNNIHEQIISSEKIVKLSESEENEREVIQKPN